MLRVGLTGGIACGKTHVLRRLAAAGLETLDLDRVAHELMDPGQLGHAAVVEAFGREILAPDGTIDRRALGRRVFLDSDARARLDALVHPLVRAEEARRAEGAALLGRAAFVTDAALLVEAGVHLRFDRLVVVHCPRELQLRRLVARDGLSEAEGLARISAQMPIEEKRRYGHEQIDTSGSLSETEAVADALASRLSALHRRPLGSRPLSLARALAAVAAGREAGPRGLSPAALLAEVAEAGGIEMGRLAHRLQPRFEGPWYRQARAGEGEPWPEALSAALVVCLRARDCMDGDAVVAAAATLARLTPADPEAVAGACLAALALDDVSRGGPLEGLTERLPSLFPLAVRWGGAPPPQRIGEAVRAAIRHAGDAGAAREAARAAGGEPALAGGLVGIAGTAPAPRFQPEIERFLLRLFGPQ